MSSEQPSEPRPELPTEPARGAVGDVAREVIRSFKEGLYAGALHGWLRDYFRAYVACSTILVLCRVGLAAAVVVLTSSRAATSPSAQVLIFLAAYSVVEVGAAVSAIRTVKRQVLQSSGSAEPRISAERSRRLEGIDA